MFFLVFLGLRFIFVFFRCLNVLQGHQNEIMGYVIITCLTDSPEIMILSFERGSHQARLGDVDSEQNEEIYSDKPFNLDFDKIGQNLVQVMRGSSGTGFVFAAVDQSYQSLGKVNIGIWGLK